MAKDIVVEIRNLTKRIGNKTIVDNLSFDIPKGEVFGLLGPNGAGKTTTIRMMVGLMSITSGDVFIDGLNIRSDFREAMKRIGCIVETPEMYKFLTGYQNLLHFARMSSDISRERINEVVELVGLKKRINDKVKTYSLGMRQRLGLAKALLHKPSVLILDEPTNGLDPAGIRELRDHLRKLANQEGLTVIVSSHLLSEMELMCDRVAVLQHGRLISVKRVHDMVSGTNEQITVFDVNQLDHAEKVISATVNRPAETTNHGLAVRVTREETSQVVEALVAAGIKVYWVNVRTKTLEESFLELTGDSDLV
ncbi:ABC transporter ATP-binding protein [Alicyclobacillus kakegawensis]|uniref:ABC transporter ATP-binding protein n=1 Tax=Alicyclobacillus kakegawensis TaxID=392012 RepID=UPI0008347E59|nr:ABC transporter ATP-binding protein [Alicyclobacillus kakegawensis]